VVHRYEFTPSAAYDLHKLTRRNQPLLRAIVLTHIPTALLNPYEAGAQKNGDLAGLHACNIRLQDVAYRLVYAIEEQLVVFVAIGRHDRAYPRVSRRS
jgi:mRNA-degrading endonuclease RelE of RelBE toxin-antitoxin system